MTVTVGPHGALKMVEGNAHSRHHGEHTLAELVL